MSVKSTAAKPTAVKSIATKSTNAKPTNAKPTAVNSAKLTPIQPIPYVPIKECYLVNNELQEASHANPDNNRNKWQKVFVWPKPAQGYTNNAVSLESVTAVSKFLSIFDSILQTDYLFQYKWSVSTEERDYSIGYKNAKNEIICKTHHFDVCKFLIKLSPEERKEVFEEIQQKFSYYDVVSGVSYQTFVNTFVFLTYMIVFLEQWNLNLLGANSLEFKFIGNDSKLATVTFSPKEYDNINKVCEMYYSIYFKFVTMSPAALCKLITIYNVYKNIQPICIYKKMRDLRANESSVTQVNQNYTLTQIESRRNTFNKQYTELLNRLNDRGDDFDPNCGEGCYLDECGGRGNFVSSKNKVSQLNETFKIILPANSRSKKYIGDSNDSLHFTKKSKIESLSFLDEKNESNDTAGILSQLYEF